MLRSADLSSNSQFAHASLQLSADYVHVPVPQPAAALQMMQTEIATHFLCIYLCVQAGLMVVAPANALAVVVVRFAAPLLGEANCKVSAFFTMQSRVWDAVRFEHFSSSATESVAGKSSVFQVGESGALRTCAATIVCR